VGHSDRTSDALAALLGEAGVGALADVRRAPASRRHPWHAREPLAARCARSDIGYVFLGDALGGRQPERLPPDRSPNAAWQEPAFRRYADALDTPAMRAGLARLETLARERVTAVLCAERDWRRCHRQILADWLALRGFEVIHLVAPGHRERHAVHGFARVRDGVLVYPALL
jgi:uncharacterized protein (DUF488 family)